jgi:hypothetical protein
MKGIIIRRDLLKGKSKEMQPMRSLKLFNLTRGALFLGILFLLVFSRTGSANWNRPEDVVVRSEEVYPGDQRPSVEGSPVVERWQPLFSIGRYSTIQY